MKEEQTQKQTPEEPGRKTLPKLLLLIFLSLAAFFAYDSFFNKKHILRKIEHWNTLQLRTHAGSVWELKKDKGLQVVELKDSALTESTLAKFDKSYRDLGFYRLYFRLSDAESDKLQRIYKNIALIDTGQSVRKTVEDITQKIQRVQRALRKDSTFVADTLKLARSDSLRSTIGTNVIGGSEKDVMDQLTALVRQNPTFLIGVGIGIAASAGVDLLGGQTFIAFSTEDLFRIDSLNSGAKAGQWEGRDVDILWAFKKQPTDSGRLKH